MPNDDMKKDLDRLAAHGIGLVGSAAALFCKGIFAVSKMAETAIANAEKNLSQNKPTDGRDDKPAISKQQT